MNYEQLLFNYTGNYLIIIEIYLNTYCTIIKNIVHLHLCHFGHNIQINHAGNNQKGYTFTFTGRN